MRTSPSLLLALTGVLLLAGCAGNPLRSYDNEMRATVTLVRAGQIDQALVELEKNNQSMFASNTAQEKDAEGKPKEASVLDSVNGKDILYYFEKGQLLNLQNDYKAGRDAWLQADEIVRTWEDEFRTNPTKLFGDIGSYLVSDRVRRYDGQDYEKVALSTKLTLNHVLLGDFDNARVEMKKTYERESLIRDFREQEYEKLKEEGDKKGFAPDMQQLAEKGYPLAELDDPEVNSLKNGYQNAFAHYLAGYFFEAQGEFSLSEPGYRNALQLQPDSTLSKQALSRKGKRRPGANESDVLFVIETGFAPAWKSITIPLPIPTGGDRIVATPLSFPVIKAENPGYVPQFILAGEQRVGVETMVNFDAMSRRLLKDQLPSILLRTGVRAILKSVMQNEAQKRGGAVAGLIAGVVSVVTEQADERSWRTLPERVAIARTIVPYGPLMLEFQTGKGVHRTEVNIGNRYTIIPIRLTGGAVLVGEQNVPGLMAADVPQVNKRRTPNRNKRPTRTNQGVK